MKNHLKGKNVTPFTQKMQSVIILVKDFFFQSVLVKDRFDVVNVDILDKIV
jgi:hypothetical protein